MTGEGMYGNDCCGHGGRRPDYGYGKEVYVDDQCCGNCRYWCGWDPLESGNGCKNYSREDYERKPQGRWCVDWKER